MSDVQPVPIPGPKGIPFLGNIYDIEQEVPMRSFELLVDQYGTYPSGHVCLLSLTLDVHPEEKHG